MYEVIPKKGGMFDAFPLTDLHCRNTAVYELVFSDNGVKRREKLSSL